jgi:DNA-binding transcriptional regulator YiaG
VTTLRKEKKWQEELKSKIKALREHALEKPELKKAQQIYTKPVVPKKSNFVETKAIKEEHAKPGVAVSIEKEDEYVVIKPILDEIKEEAKEKFREAKIKEVKLVEKIEPVKKIEPSKEDLKEIETAIDKMIEILNDRGSVTILELSKQLGVSIEHVESWAKILEDKGLIEMEYPLIGPSRLRKKEWKKES